MVDVERRHTFEIGQVEANGCSIALAVSKSRTGCVPDGSERGCVPDGFGAGCVPASFY